MTLDGRRLQGGGYNYDTSLALLFSDTLELINLPSLSYFEL